MTSFATLAREKYVDVECVCCDLPIFQPVSIPQIASLLKDVLRWGQFTQLQLVVAAYAMLTAATGKTELGVIPKVYIIILSGVVIDLLYYYCCWIVYCPFEFPRIRLLLFLFSFYNYFIPTT